MAKNIALQELGMKSATQPNTAQTEHHDLENVENRFPMAIESAEQCDGFDGPDHFVQRDGLTFAGTHLIIDLWGASRLDDLAYIDATLRASVVACGATLLHLHLHHFTPNSGVSGVAVLAESHISIHTWPERDYAALDVFMCGDAQPHKAIEILRAAFSPSSVNISEQKRGIL
jgi:S-adenosylmethionine decarboxylase